MFGLLRKIFKHKEKGVCNEPYIERDTICDKCEMKDGCNLIEITMLADSRRHFIQGFGNECKLYKVGD